MTPDDVLAVLRKEAAGGVREAGDVVEQLVELRFATLHGVAGRHLVAQGGGDVGEHLGVEVGRLRQQTEVLHERGDLRVHPPQVGVERLEVLAEPVSATLEGGRERVEGLVDLGRLDGAQQRVEVVERLLHLGGHHGLLDRVARLDGVAGRPVVRDLEGDVLLAEERLGLDPRGHVGRDGVDLAGVEAELEAGAVAAGRHVEHLAHEHATELDVGALGKLQTRARGLQRDLLVVGELLGEDREGEPHARADQGDEEHPDQLGVAQHAHLPITRPIGRSWWYPRWPSTGTGRSR